MTKLKILDEVKRLKMKLCASWLVVLLVGTAGVGAVSFASFGDARSLLLDKLTAKVSPEAVLQWALGAPETPQIVEETFGAVANGGQASNLSCTSLDCTYSLSLTNAVSATDTLFAFTNPFSVATTSNADVTITRSEDLVNGTGQTGASSTVTSARVYITTAPAAAYTFVCGAAASTSSLPLANLLTSDTVPTSTAAVVENGIANSQVTNVGGGSVQKTMIGPQFPFFVCKATATDKVSLSTVTSTFAGRMIIRVSRLRF